MKKPFVWLLALLLCATSFAVEGMYPLNELDKLDQQKLKKMGLNIPLSDVRDHVAKAVVSLGGGSGSFVSPNGLIITNHHVAYRAIQFNSDENHNYIADGFYAPTRQDELPAPGYYAEIIQDVKDVTADIMKSVTADMDDDARMKAVDDAIKRMESEVEQANPGIRASIASMYQGTQFLLYTAIRLNDVRLVYAPPSSIGAFGGDDDNFEWPRHTGDFSFLRAYVSPDGKPASFSKENVPYQPAHYLKISIKPLKKGDFNFVVGFPGRTNRYMTAEQIAFFVQDEVPFRLKLFRETIDILNEIGSQSRENSIRVAFWVMALNNTLKYYQGVYDGLNRDHVVKRFEQRDKMLTEWIKANDKAQEYGGVIDEINQQNERTKAISATLTIMGYTRLIPTFSAAGTITRWAEEKAKPDMERDPAYMERNVERMKQRMSSMQNDLLVESDKRLLKYFLNLMGTLPADRQPETFHKMFTGVPADQLGEAIDKKVDAMYAETGLVDEATRMKYMEMSAEELATVNDPLLQFGGDFAKELKAATDRTDSIAGAMMRLKPKFIQLIHEATDNQLYPDANSTIRFTYGTIQGYSPQEAVWYSPFTSLAGVAAKDTGKAPFNSPAKLLDLAASGSYGRYAADTVHGSVPVDFLSDVDTTGGNSGSPTLNGNGELIGLLFDGNYESISADYYFNPALTRSIIADSRYVIFLLDRFSGATGLLKELTIVE